MRVAKVLVFTLCVVGLAATGHAQVEVECDTTLVWREVGGYYYYFSSCNQPGAYCYPAPCGLDGRCQHASYWDNFRTECFCAQTAWFDQYWLNKVAYIHSNLQSVSNTMRLDLCPQPEEAWQELMIFYDTYEEEIGHVGTAMQGALEILWTSQTAGTIQSFSLEHDGYDYFGEETGTNTWSLVNPNEPVSFDIFDETVTSDGPMEMTVTNDLGTFNGWLNIEFTTMYSLEEVTLLRVRASSEAPEPATGLRQEMHWATIKALYR